MGYRGKKQIMYDQETEKQSPYLSHEQTHGYSFLPHGYYSQWKRKDAEKKRRYRQRNAREAEKLEMQAGKLTAKAAGMARWSAQDARELIKSAQRLLDAAQRLRKERPEGLTMMLYKPVPSEKRFTGTGGWPSYSCMPVKPEVDRRSKEIKAQIESGERNFMDGISYRVNPIDTLKMITASSVFGEPQYYRDGEHAEATIMRDVYGIDRLFTRFSLEAMDSFKGMTTAQVMEKAIDEALDADFGGVLDWAAELRETYLMRLNPQVIMVRAAMHPGREAYTRAHPGRFAEIEQRVMARGDDVSGQIRYYLEKTGSKRGMPAILKRAWAKRIAAMDAYAMAKYGKAGVGLVDAVRLCHAKGPLVDTLMREGRVPMPEGENTWERLRAGGMAWADILKEIRVPHMALLRNLRGIFDEVRDPQTHKDALALLKRGVRRGRQFPFRYLSAYRAIEEAGRPWAGQVKRALDECINIACENLPQLPGRCAFLTDNSGSAWCTCTSEWGTMQVAEIGNLSSVIGAMRAEEGVVFPFGDKLKEVPVHQGEGVLAQTRRVSTVGQDCGMATENGVWLFFRDAIYERRHWDSIFIYSDMQAGHGGLYGVNPEDYEVLGCCVNGMYIDVNRLVQLYREQVNPKVNVYCIQTAGYTNAVVPEYGYRTAILYGWTGKELIFADAMRRIWDDVESNQPSGG